MDYKARDWRDSRADRGLPTIVNPGLSTAPCTVLLSPSRNVPEAYPVRLQNKTNAERLKLSPSP